LPKSARFTFGQRLDNLTLDALNLLLEQLRVLWRLVEQRGWISQQQLLFANGRLGEIGRMTGGWLKQVERSGA
jgi:hypothetical protein